MNATDFLELADYRRRVHAHYAAVRDTANPQEAWEMWRQHRDDLFREHPQSPLEAAERTVGYRTPFAAYDPRYRLTASVTPVDEPSVPVAHSSAGTTTFRSIGTLSASLPGGDVELGLLWLDTYGGGLFLPFRDATSGTTSYGGGRYLLDTAKGADLGTEEGRLVLDFNFAYHPSCVYSSRWSCPLAPPQNHLDVPIPVGEQMRRSWNPVT